MVLLQAMRLLAVIILLGAADAAAHTLSLDEYLALVRQANHGMRSSTAQIDASQLRESALDQVYTPQFFSQIASQIDEKPQANALAGNKTAANNLSFGVQKLWQSGLQSQLSYQVNQVAISRDPVPPLLAPGVPNPLSALGEDQNFNEAQTRLDLVQPLWKNWAGREIQMNRSMAEARLSLQTKSEQYKMRSLLTQAEFIYWQLALASEAVRAQQGTLQRFQKIRDWIANRVQMSLADKADLLQAEAGAKVRRLELELALRDKASLQRSFNSLRGAAGDTIEGELLPISSRMFADVQLPQGPVKRLDIEVAKQMEKVATIEVDQLRERHSPQLDVFGTLALNSDLEDNFGKAVTGAISSDKPTMIVGLKFSTPLDRELINRERNGLIKASEASRIERESREFNAKQEWDELFRQLGDARVRLQLATEIESSQKQKLDYEKERHERGRTTTYQILLFEQDYASSQLGSIKAKADILGIIAKIKMFGDAI